MALPGVLCSPVMADVARGTHRGCCWCWQCHTELIDNLEQQKHRGRHSLSLLWKAVPQHIHPSSFLCTLGLRPDVTKSLLLDGPSVLCHLSQKAEKSLLSSGVIWIPR